MRKRALWLGLSFLMVASLVLTGCPPPQVVDPPVLIDPVVDPVIVDPVVDPVVVDPDVPRHGGTLTVFLEGSAHEPGVPHLAEPTIVAARWRSLIQERLLMGDFETYGPRGTGESPFLARHIPDGLLTGLLAESWEFCTERVVFHIRPGVMWQGLNQGVRVMDDRELTAHDVVAAIKHFRDSAAGLAFRPTVGDIYAPDRFTVVLEIAEFDIGFMRRIGLGSQAYIVPPEVREAGEHLWASQVGTGPFMLHEHVVGSHMTYARNPHWWQSTTIGGVVHDDIPFLDYIVRPVILDDATQIAALRTGTIDIHTTVWPWKWPAILDTAPGILSVRAAGCMGNTIQLNVTVPPFDDVRVRRAMQIAMNQPFVAALHGIGPLPIHWWPVSMGDPGVYTPLADLPADYRILFDHNPELAKEMLAEAGWPDGFTTHYNTIVATRLLDRAALFKDVWADAGVTLDIRGHEAPVYSRIVRERDFHGGGITNWFGVGCAVFAIHRFRTGHPSNHGEWSNARFDVLVDKIIVELDIDKRNQWIREASLILLYERPMIVTDIMPKGHFWWPWIRNYYGERHVGDEGPTAVLGRVWLDETMKSDMGFRVD